MSFHSETTLINACRTLFGQDVNLSQDFLFYLQPSGAKSAFRNQAKAHHPDRHASSSPLVRKQQTEKFREIRQAYDILIDYLDKRHLQRIKTSTRQPTKKPAYQSPGAASRHKPQNPHVKPTSIPAIPLEFGMYTFYQGKVSYQQLIEALVWQRRQRPTLGAIAQKWGWLTEAKVAHTLGYRGHAVRFGKKAIELGYLKQHQVDALLQYQQSLQKRIGQYFIEKGLLSKEEADLISQKLEAHNHQINLRAKNRSGKNR